MTKNLMASLLLLLSAACVMSAQPGDRRPRSRRMAYQTDTVMVHDPVMACERGTYYLLSTGNGLQWATSKDRQSWIVQPTPFVENLPAWTRDSVPGFRSHVWAPDVIRWHDRWWLAYSCSTFGKNSSAIGLMSADRLNGHWRDEGCLVASKEDRDNWNAIDPAFVIDDNDQLWMAWGSVWFILKHGGWYYLFVSWDYCCRGSKSNYRVAVGRSKTVDGPYHDREGKPMTNGGGTLFLEGDKQEFEAVGHCAAYNMENGETIFICHGYSTRLNGTSILIQRNVTWTADGWPVLANTEGKTK